MADLATITIPVDSSAMVRAVKDAKSLEGSIKLLTNALDSGVIGQKQFDAGLAQLEKQFKNLFKSADGATSSILGYVQSLRESKSATEAAAKSKNDLAMATKRAETAFALANQKAQEELQTLKNRAEFAWAMAMQRERESQAAVRAAEQQAKAEANLTAELLRQRNAVEQATRAKAQAAQAQIGSNLGLGSTNAIGNGAGFGAMEGEIERLRVKYDSAYAASKLFEAQSKELSFAMLNQAGNADTLKNELDKLQAEYAAFGAGTADLTNRFNQQAAAVEQSRKGVNKFGLLVQQSGYQAGDFLVQIQSGTNAFVAFGQQATQLVGILPMFAAELGVSAVALGGITLGLSIAIPLITAIGAYFMRTGEGAEQGAKGIDIYKAALDSLKSTVQSTQVELDKLTFGTFDAEVAVARRAMQTAQEELQALQAASMRTTARGIIYDPNAEQEAAIKAALEGFRNLTIELDKLLFKQEALSEAQRMLNGGLSVAGGLQRAAVLSKQEELRAAKDYEQVLIRSYQYMGETMRLSAEQVASYEKENEAINNRLVMEVAIAKFGKDSAEVKKMQLQEQLDLYNQGIDKQVLLGVYSEAQGAALKDSNLIRVEAVALQQEETDALNKGKELVRELLSTYLDISKTVEDISKVDLKSVFEDAIPASSALYQFVANTFDAMVKITDAAAAAKRTEYYKLGTLNEGAMGRAGAAGQGLAESYSFVEKAAKKLTGTTKTLNKELTDAEKAAKEFADSMQGYVVGAVQSVSDAFGDFVMRGFKDFKGFVNSILSSFTSMLAQMIALAARNQIMISMGMSGAGMVAGGAASAAAGAVGGAGMGMLGGIATGIGGAFGTIGSGLMAGAGLALNGGMAGIVGGVTGGISAGGLAGISTAIGAIAAPLLAVAAVFSFFKKKTKELDSGLRITVNNMDALVETFKKTETKRFWGLQRKTSSSTEAASLEIADPIETAVSAIQNSIVDMAGALNIGSEAFDNFYFQLKVSLKGLSAEEATAKIQEELMKVGDAMAEMIPDLVALSQGSETASETLTRLYTSLQLANAYFGPLIDTLFQASLAGADLASTMVQAFGSLDAFNSNMAFFAENFYTQAEQIAWASDRVNKAFTDLGMTAPATADAFRILVEDLMKATTSGVEGAAEQLAAVLAVQQDMLAVSVYEAEQAAEAQRLAIQLGEEARRLQEQLAIEAARAAEEAAKNALRTAEEKATLEIQLLEAQGKAVEALKLQREAELAALDETNRAILQQIFDLEDLAAAQTLANEAAKEATRIANEAAQEATRIANEAAQEAIRIAEERSSLDIQLLELQGKAAEALKLQREAELAALSETNRAILQQIFDLQDLNAAQKLANEAAQAAEEAAQARREAAQRAAEKAAQKAEEIAQERYALETQLLELQGNTVELRNRELALLDPTNRALQQMVWKLSDAKDALTEINEIDFATKVDYLRAVGVARGGIAGFAAGGMHSGGARIVGENGPELEVTGPSRIYNKQDTSNMFRDPDLASAVEGLRNEVSGMRSEQLQLQVEISKNTKRVYDVERKWDIDGLPPVRV